jgi:hypothetical protein
VDKVEAVEEKDEEDEDDVVVHEVTIVVVVVVRQPVFLPTNHRPLTIVKTTTTQIGPLMVITPNSPKSATTTTTTIAVHKNLFPIPLEGTNVEGPSTRTVPGTETETTLRIVPAARTIMTRMILHPSHTGHWTSVWNGTIPRIQPSFEVPSGSCQAEMPRHFAHVTEECTRRMF